MTLAVGGIGAARPVRRRGGGGCAPETTNGAGELATDVRARFAGLSAAGGTRGSGGAAGGGGLLGRGVRRLRRVLPGLLVTARRRTLVVARLAPAVGLAAAPVAVLL